MPGLLLHDRILQMKLRIVVVLATLLLIIASPFLWWYYPGWLFHFYSGSPSAAEEKARNAVPYRVVYEDMGSLIEITVPANISEEQLRATLVKVANESQDEPGRDYLISEHLWVRAYLYERERRSKEAAGLLARYVPWKNPQERKQMKVDRSLFDKFQISVAQAKNSF